MARTFIPHTITDDSAIGGQKIEGSTVFNDDHETFLFQNFSSAGNRRTWTISHWIKFYDVDSTSSQRFWSSGDSGSGDVIKVEYYSGSSTRKLALIDNNHASSGIRFTTNQHFRDNVWYHIVFAVDTTEATASDRVKIYVNGERITEWESGSEHNHPPNQNYDTSMNVSGKGLAFGRAYAFSAGSATYADMQMSQLYLIDGQQLEPTSFGYTESQSGIWRPKKYTGTFGTTGFYFPLDGSQHISRDISGNGNHFTPYNMRCTVPLHMATGGLPILNTNEGGTVARPGVRPDPLASNIVLALPLSNRYQAIGTDVHHLIKGSGSPKTLTNTGSVGSNASYFNFYGRSGNANIENASNQKIDISPSDDFNMGTGDFTVECWIYPKSTSAADGSLFVLQTLTGGEAYFAFNFDPGGEFNIYLNTASAGWSPSAPENLIEYTKWNHVALVKHSNVVKLYVNGLAIGSYNHTGQVGYDASVTTICRIGGGGSSSLNVYMQDMRIYKGVAKYTDTFTCASTDSSVIPDSPSGIVVPRKFRQSLSGSVGFDGSGDKITANSTDFVFGTDDFTVEATVYKTAMTFGGFSGAFIFGQTNNDAGGRNGVAFGYKDGGLWLLQGNGSGWSVETTVDVFPTNQWVHIAVSKNSGTTRYFINGKLVYTYSTNLNLGADNNGDISIGSINTSSMDWDGHISNFRIIKGTGLYTSSFTPPTEPLTNVTNTKLLCCQDKFSVTAKAVGPTLTAVGAVVTSDFSPFGDDTISPAGGYPILNRLRGRKAGTVAEGNFFLNGGNYTLQLASVVFGPGNITTGKYIWEIDNSGGDGTSIMYAGITQEFNQGAGEIFGQANKTILSSNLHKIFNQTSTTASRTNEGQGVSTFLLDVDNRILRGYYDTRLIFTDTTIPDATTTEYAPFIFSTNDGNSGNNWVDAHFNFGQRPFIFTPPEGYESLSFANLEPSSIINPRRHFECLTYTGDGSSNNRVTGLQFKPDLVWIKSFSASTDHIVQDSVRGNFILYPNTTAPDGATGGGWVKSFNPDGFTTDVNGPINTNSASYAAWCWKAGGNSNTFNVDGVGYASASAAGITDGTVPLTGASVNTKAGFSIVTYDGNSSGSTTFGHGLSQAPEIFFLKSRDNTEDWRIYYTIADGSYDFMYFTSTSVMHSGYNLPTSTLINKADDNGESMVAYIWHSVPGYSKMGSYQGNGSTNGKFVYTGFRPAFVLLKRHTDGSNYWEIRDNKRDPNNPANSRLFPNRSDSQSVGEGIDFLNNGFKLRNSGSGSNSNDKAYIYMAFAEQPSPNQYGAQPNAR